MANPKTKLSTEDKFQAKRAKKSEAYGQVRLIALDLHPRLAEMPDHAQIALVDRVFEQALFLDDKGTVDIDETLELAGDLRQALTEARAFAEEHFAIGALSNEWQRALVVDKVFAMAMLDEDDDLDTEGADEKLQVIVASLEDAHIHERAREDYGSESPLALLAAVEADLGWFDE